MRLSGAVAANVSQTLSHQGDNHSVASTCTNNAGNSSLQYDPDTQRYICVWKTGKAWAGTCRQLIVKLIDGSEHVALFQFNGKVRSAAVDYEATVTQQVFLPLVNR